MRSGRMKPLLSISTDKVDMDIESNVDGVLRDILVEEGADGACGNCVGTSRGGGKAALNACARALSRSACGGAKPAVRLRNSAQLDSALEEDRAEGDAFGPRLAPRRNEPDELGIDIATVKGSGPEGRIVEKDLLNLAPPRTAAASSHARRETAPVDCREHDWKAFAPYQPSRCR